MGRIRGGGYPPHRAPAIGPVRRGHSAPTEHVLYVDGGGAALYDANEGRGLPPITAAPRGSCQTPGPAKILETMTKLHATLRRSLLWLALLTAAGGMLAACDTPVGRAPNLQGDYWQNALVTNPNGGGPQVVRWGPPQNYNPSMPH